MISQQDVIMKSGTFKVAEIFGPTIQGEGPNTGSPCYFVRFGGCDYRCLWCDSMHAVDPALVRKLPNMTAEEIHEKVLALPGRYPWVVFSGGNPALWDLSELVRLFHVTGNRVAVETQGTFWNAWMGKADLIVVSPKPPSAGRSTPLEAVKMFMINIQREQLIGRTFFKFVVFDQEDLNYVNHILTKGAYWVGNTPIYLSTGTLATDTSTDVLRRYKWLTETALSFFGQQTLWEINVGAQQHVLLWGHALGV